MSKLNLVRLLIKPGIDSQKLIFASVDTDTWNFVNYEVSNPFQIETNSATRFDHSESDLPEKIDGVFVRFFDFKKFKHRNLVFLILNSEPYIGVDDQIVEFSPTALKHRKTFLPGFLKFELNFNSRVSRFIGIKPLLAGWFVSSWFDEMDLSPLGHFLSVFSNETEVNYYSARMKAGTFNLDEFIYSPYNPEIRATTSKSK